MALASQRVLLPPARELFERYGALVYRRCRKMLGSEEAARDAVQDIFLKVVEKSHLYRGDSAPSTWLYAMATLHCLQRLRDRIAHGAKLEELAKETDRPLGVAREDHLAVIRLLEGQPDDLRLMVYLRCVDEMTLEEVAELVGYSRKTVAQRVNQFLGVAREHLSAGGATP